MDMRIFDNYEDDGQLSLFGTEEESSVEGNRQESNGVDVRIGRCSGCGKLLFVKEENAGYVSECSNCSIKYFQKKN